MASAQEVRAMNTNWLRSTCLLAGIFSSAFAALAYLEPRPRLLWNASASAPVGLYLVDSYAFPKPGDLVVLTPTDDIAHLIGERGYLPAGVPLLKRIAAMPGQTVCRRGAAVSIDDAPVALARARDSVGRVMPVWQGCRGIAAGGLFLLNPVADSLDGRYFGPASSSNVIGIARPLLIRRRPGAPLRWHPGEGPERPTTRQQEHRP